MSDLLGALPGAELRRAVKLRQALQCLTAPLASGLLTNQKLVQVEARLNLPDKANATAQMFVYGGGDIVSGWVSSKQGWEHGELAELFWAMQRGRAAAGDAGGPLFVDIGANIGHFTVHMAKAGYRVVAFEGTPDNIGLLQSTLCANPDFAHRVTLYPTGLSYYNASCEIFTDPNNQGNGLTVCKEDDRKRDFVTRSSYIKRGVMELRRLDDLMLESDVVSAMKIDTEGHELSIIKGGARLFQRGGVRYVMMEVLKDLLGDDQTKELLSTLVGHGFRISPKSFKGPWLTEAEIAAASVVHGSNIFCAHKSTFPAGN